MADNFCNILAPVHYIIIQCNPWLQYIATLELQYQVFGSIEKVVYGW